MEFNFEIRLRFKVGCFENSEINISFSLVKDSNEPIKSISIQVSIFLFTMLRYYKSYNTKVNTFKTNVPTKIDNTFHQQF